MSGVAGAVAQVVIGLVVGYVMFLALTTLVI